AVQLLVERFIGSKNLRAHRRTVVRIAAELDRDLDVFCGVRGDTVQDTHLFVQGQGDASPEEERRKSHNGNAKGQALVTGIAPTEMDRVQQHIGNGVQVQKIIARLGWHKTDSLQDIRECDREALHQELIPVLGPSMDQDDVSQRVLSKNTTQNL